MKFAVGISLTLCYFVFAEGQTPSPTPTPAQIREEVVVTANRIETRIGDAPASVGTFSRSEIESAAAPAVDDILRQSAGFSIFRRSSSRNANPTTQGVSLRGIGASGASRSVVLLDGVPLNDPFGGWVQWNRVTPIAVESVEVLRGGASSLYGNAGLSGAIKVIPRKIEDKFAFSTDVFGGIQKTLSGTVFAGFKSGGWLAEVAGSSFQTKGFKPVDEAARGPVDAFAGVRSSNISAKLTRHFGEQASVFVRPSYFGEVRTNGTGMQTNRTHIRQIVFGGDHVSSPTVKKGLFSDIHLNWRLYGGTQVFDQVFSAVNAVRTTESLTRVQRVPAQNAGLSAQLSTVYEDHTFVGGIDLRDVRGASDEIAFTNGQPSAITGSGGRENTAGAFIQDFAKIGRKLVIAGSIRFDRCRNFAALRSTRTLATNQIVTTAFPDRNEDAISPQIAVLYHLSDEFSLYANASRSFRGPTLNELYRAFRVGNVLTLANESLLAERANNIEAGVGYSKKSIYFRASGFWMNIDRSIANVTLSSTPSLITRQRQNAGRTRSRGIEIEVETRLKTINFSAGYLFADSQVVNFPSNIQLVGLMIPQVARHQFTFQMRYSHRDWTFAVQGRASSRQFDDDLNLFSLEPYAQVDVFGAKRLNEKLQVYAALENVFNSRYSVGKTPVRTVSSPANLRIGIRWK